ncbi:hypothetical protein FV140_04370 [Paenarthrobacter ureafaciens]|nr:hypothetical protein FV140_04370 [Paenarthrobacter ureafaciens]
MTETESLAELTTYTECVRGSTAMAAGDCPTTTFVVNTPFRKTETVSPFRSAA